MCVAALCVSVANYAIDSGMKSIQEFQAVEAGQDPSFEQDDIYYAYVESAKLQVDLMEKEKRGRHTWTLDHYRRFQARKLQALASQLALRDDLDAGTDRWWKTVPGGNFDALPAPAKTGDKYSFKNAEYGDYIISKQAQGYYEEYYTEEQCYSSMINTPGVSLLPVGLMGPAYFAFLIYLFLGISISADIFMEAIEVITSRTSLVAYYDKENDTIVQVPETVWNATMANLTLMAFGSSAPEIILSVLEALKDLGKEAGELGPSTIVGSAAFNLLVISAVSVSAVGGKTGDVKKIDDMGVFVITGTSSVFAYIWLYLCLSINTPGEVTTGEAYWTLGFFGILLVLAFGADKYNQIKKKKQKSAETEKENQLKVSEAHLRSIARQKGEKATLMAAQGKRVDPLTENEVQQIRDLYMEVLGENDLSKVPLDRLMACLRPKALFERFAARKANQVGSVQEFMEIKGQKF